MQAGLPELDSVDAQRGRLFHRYWGNKEYDRSFLTQDERDLLELSDRLAGDVLNRLGFEMGETMFIEQVFNTRDLKLTGTPDRVHWWHERDNALILDLKSGFKVVERAELNLQLRGYALLVGDALEAKHVYVSILQPRLGLPSDRISLAHYEQSDIRRSRDQIYKIIDDSERPDAPLIAGEEQCQFCRAKLICPAFRKKMTLPVAKFKSDIELSKAAREAWILERIKLCSDDELEQLREAIKLASFIEEPANDEARERIKAGRFEKFYLGKEGEVRSITNVGKAIAMLALSRVASREQVFDICDLPLHKLETDYRKRNGGTWQEARDKINKVLASVIAREPRRARILPKAVNTKTKNQIKNQ
jgi:hypothetical protein